MFVAVMLAAATGWVKRNIRGECRCNLMYETEWRRVFYVRVQCPPHFLPRGGGQREGQKLDAHYIHGLRGARYGRGSASKRSTTSLLPHAASCAVMRTLTGSRAAQGAAFKAISVKAMLSSNMLRPLLCPSTARGQVARSQGVVPRRSEWERQRKANGQEWMDSQVYIDDSVAVNQF